MPEINLGKVVGPQGPQGPKGDTGPAGPAGAAASINGTNTLTLNAEAPVTAVQAGNTLTLGLEGGAVSNSNMLDNWYFAVPINQRGQTEYTGLVSGWGCIDRWAAVSSGGLVTNYNSGTGLLSGGDATNFVGLTQKIEEFEALSGQTVTISALLRGATSSGYVQLWGKDQEKGSTKSLLNNNYTANSGTFLVTGTVTLPKLYALQMPIQTHGSVTLIAAKLELGGRQTLAHQDASGNWVLNDPPPNKALELAKCQRYLQRLTKYMPLIVVTSNDIYTDYLYAGPPLRTQGTLIHPENIDPEATEGYLAEFYCDMTNTHRLRANGVKNKTSGSMTYIRDSNCFISAEL